jgi:hypothetical protein
MNELREGGYIDGLVVNDKTPEAVRVRLINELMKLAG